ncbi:MAG: EamA family transporter RarD [Spirochaetales bacterium]|nr:EamA family transporter RarD [Spirochaetales bacterium]
MDNKKSGILYAFSAYLIWGFLAAYWKIFSGIPALEIMAHRMFWAFCIVFAVLLMSGKVRGVADVFRNRNTRWRVIIRAAILAVNWYTYIWAISNGYILEASLGYYLNPLVSIFLGLIFLQERLSKLQWAAVGFAIAGVALKTILVGMFPVIAVVLAFSFGLYGLMKKKSTEGSFIGVASETLVVLPFAAAYLLFSEITGPAHFVEASVWMKLLFATTGVVTVVPLFLFSKGTGRIPLIWIGFLQFIAPTLMMVFGIFMYHETLTAFDLAGFAAVWVGILIFLLSFRKAY